MNIRTHLTFDGECEAAFQLYASCLEGEILFLLRYGEAAQECAAEQAGKVLHATLRVGEQILTGVDHLRADYKRQQGFAVQLNLRERKRAEIILRR